MHSIYMKYTSHNHKQLMKSGGSSSDHYFWYKYFGMTLSTLPKHFGKLSTAEFGKIMAKHKFCPHLLVETTCFTLYIEMRNLH